MSPVGSRCGTEILLRPRITHLEHWLTKEVTKIAEITRVMSRWGRQGAEVIPLPLRRAVHRASVVFPQNKIVHLRELVGNVVLEFMSPHDGERQVMVLNTGRFEAPRRIRFRLTYNLM